MSGTALVWRRSPAPSGAVLWRFTVTEGDEAASDSQVCLALHQNEAVVGPTLGGLLSRRLGAFPKTSVATLRNDVAPAGPRIERQGPAWLAQRADALLANSSSSLRALVADTMLPFSS